MNDKALSRLSIQTLDDLERAAKILAPAFNLKFEQAMAIMLISQSDGIHPVLGIRLYDIIQGKPAPKATTVLTWFLERGGKVDWIEYSATRAAGFFSHPVNCPEPKLFELTIEEAKQRNLHQSWDFQAKRWEPKHNWTYQTAAMLRARVVTAAVRMIDPGALNGQHIADELLDADLKDAQVEGVRDESQPAPRHERVRQLAEEGERRVAEKATGEATEKAQEPPAPKIEPTPPAKTDAPAMSRAEEDAKIREAKQKADELRGMFDANGKAPAKAPPLFSPEEQKRIDAQKAADAAAAAPRSRVEPGQTVTVQHLLEAGKELRALVGDVACSKTVTRLNEQYECGIKKTPGKPDTRALTLCPAANCRGYLGELEEEIRVIKAERAAAKEVAHV